MTYEEQLSAAIKEQKAIHDKALAEDRPFSREECIKLDELKVRIESYQRRLRG